MSTILCFSCLFSTTVHVELLAVSEENEGIAPVGASVQSQLSKNIFCDPYMFFCMFLLCLSVGLERLEMLDKRIQELHLLAAADVHFRTAFLEGSVDAMMWLCISEAQSLSTAVLRFSVLFCSSHVYAHFLYGEILSTEVNHRQIHSKTGKNRTKVSWLLL